MGNTNSHDQFKREALNRIKRARGHLAKVQKMLEEGAYCPDVILQSRAVQAALKKSDQVILHGHLHSCVFRDAHGKGSEKMIGEIVDLFGKND